MADQLIQHDVTVIFIQATYAKALQAILQNQEQFTRLVVRLGSFHTICSFLAGIGERLGGSGFAYIPVEGGIVGSGFVASVLEKRHYNRAVRKHKVWK